MSTTCGHPLCALIGGSCSLLAGFSRGCSSDLRRRSDVDPEVFDEIERLLPLVDGGDRDAAVRLAAIIRREAREGRGVMAQARDEAPELAPALERLCTRAPGGAR